MIVTKVDSSWEHLLPEFAVKLRKVLDETKSATGFHWVMQEGYRSVARQEWLYQQGRSRPGQIVTWMRTPKNHGAGIAADCYPTRNGKTPDFKIGLPAYEQFRTIYHRHGLSNPAWGKGDLGHVELPALRAEGLAWVKAGFPRPLGVTREVRFGTRPLHPSAVRVDEQGNTWVQLGALRPELLVEWDAAADRVTLKNPQE